MSNPNPDQVPTEKAFTFRSKALDMIGTGRSVRRMAIKLGVTLVLVLVALSFVPWQQTVPGTGQIAVYDAMSRPQSVEAQIPGRLVSWEVQEGQEVKVGDVIARIEDIDSKFLDPNQLKRLREQRDFVKQTASETLQRVAELTSQRSELSSARQDSIRVARQAIGQAKQRQKGLEKMLEQAQQNLNVRRKVGAQSAKERANQAKDRVDQAQQSLVAANQQQETMKLRYERIAYLAKESLRSKQDMELAENDWVKAKTQVAQAEKGLEIAKRDLTVGNLAEDQVQIEIRAAEAAVGKAQADLRVAEQDVTNAMLNLSRIISDSQAQLSRVGADVQSAKESLAKNSGDIQKIEVEVSNVVGRDNQQVIRAPVSGRVARLLQVGAGSTVKAGDELATIVPTTQDRVVELFVSDNDVVLLDVGRMVRLQFAGWPALQFSGFPSVAVGTFGGRIKVIDPVDDGTSRYRVIVEQDQLTFSAGHKDEPWPDPKRLRPGAKAVGWIMLDSVPLGYELWRQFNGFPPRVNPGSQKSYKQGGGDSKPAKDPGYGPVKLKSK